MVRRIAAAQNNGSLRGKTIALLGLTFKADTDDMREAVSIPLAQALLDAGSRVRAYDPVATERAQTLLPARIEYCASALQAASGADAIVIATEWSEFKRLDYRVLRARMKTPLVIDLRNLLSEPQLRLDGFKYVGIGGARRAAFDPPAKAPRWRRTSPDSPSIAAAE
jgi:UDPglucose 6-dehydrogenase